MAQQRTNKKLIIINVVIVVCVFLLVYAVTGILREQLKATATQTTYDEVSLTAVKEDHASVDFSVVKSAGTTATSWIYIPDTRIDYPIVQGANNDFYIDRDAFGNPSESGAIFINFANASDMSDFKTVIFGHNMSDGSMFSDLHKYSDAEFAQTHQNAYIFMENGDVKHYRLLYYVYTQPLDPAIYVVSSQETGDDFVASIEAEPKMTKFKEYQGGNVICLSTCSMHVNRTVVVFEYADDAKPILGSGAMKEAQSKVGNTEVETATEEISQ